MNEHGKCNHGCCEYNLGEWMHWEFFTIPTFPYYCPTTGQKLNEDGTVGQTYEQLEVRLAELEAAAWRMEFAAQALERR